MGGIANFTYLPASQRADEVFTTDTGPGNTLIDAFTRKYFDKPYDENGALAAVGQVKPKLLESLKDQPFFKANSPKTTGPEVFNATYVQEAQKQSGTKAITPKDLLATLTRFSAETIADAINRTIDKNEKYTLYASGGGAHNPLLMQHIRKQLPNLEIKNMEILGVAGDAKEAVLFAILANETVTGGTTNFGTREGVPSVRMGKVSFPG